MSAQPTTDDSLATASPVGRNVLVLAPSMERRLETQYDTLLDDTTGRPDVIAVSFTRSPDAVFDVLNGRTNRLAVVCCDEPVRGASARYPTLVPNMPAVSSVKSPRDMTGIGITMSELVDQLDATETPIRVDFDSITTLLQYADASRVFRFLHVLSGRLSAAGATSHFHMDPAAHDDRTVATMRSLCDTVVRYEDGVWVAEP